MKILAIHNILWSHYKARIFCGIHESLSAKNVQFFVLQLAYSERSRLALKTDLSVHKYPYKVLFPEKAIEDIGLVKKVFRVLAHVRAFKPDVIYLNGYYDLAYWFVLVYCKLNNVKLVLDFESNEISRQRIPWKEYLKKKFLSNCDGLVCLGTKAAEYALKLGVGRDKILSIRNVGVDNDALLSIYQTEYLLRNERKKEMGLPEFNFVYAGRFVERKNLDKLIKAFNEAQKISGNGQSWGLILSGEGGYKPKLVNLISDLKNNSVIFMDPCEWYEVPIRYTLGDVAVLPSLFEPFGFVTNEALVYSMPVLVSDRCGSAADLVIDNHNGFQFNPYDEKDLLEKVILMMNHTEKFNEWGKNGSKIIAEWSPDIIVNELVKSFFKVTGK
ncbi:group 1 glycosyl transferase [Dyadobacter luteus]|jgi:glycosyltransferase involved in cell wall biosynthesis|uniref:Group 1 glycosyl transferase n=1 Tax=Dyadobacter luteus TaxID=2259619 RepID=A0A3D8YDU8_9BACT|nr:glycosyltransferase family 4 protein [Dyadobacter luteus]REA62700.1 group 1 glycosyl transferase [Dyadobacter luteus]